MSNVNERLLSQMDEGKSAKDVVDSLLDEQELRTTADGKNLHSHPLNVNDQGTGSTGPADNGPPHSHKVVGWEVFPSQDDPSDFGHKHDVVSAVGGAV